MGHEPNYTTVSARGCIVDVKVCPEAVKLPDTAVCFGCSRPASNRGEGLALPATSLRSPSLLPTLPNPPALRLRAEAA